MSIWDDLFRERLDQNLHSEYLHAVLNVLENIEKDLKSIADTERQRLQVDTAISATLHQIQVSLTGQPRPVTRLVFHLGKPTQQ